MKVDKCRHSFRMNDQLTIRDGHIVDTWRIAARGKVR